MDDVPQILDAAQHGDGWGIVAWENNVEGYVVPNLDALIDAKDLVGFARVGVNVEFDAYVAQGADSAEARIATAHPHGLAQTIHRRTSALHTAGHIQRGGLPGPYPR